MRYLFILFLSLAVSFCNAQVLFQNFDVNKSGDLFTNSAQMIVYNNKLFFQGHDASKGNELFISDGTSSGTVVLKDIYPGISQLQKGADIGNFTLFNNLLFFTATDSVHGNELWVTDGTESGTNMVKDINPTGGSFAKYFIVCNSKLYFSATDSGGNFELWVTDGTTNGTNLVKEINPGKKNSSQFAFPILFNNKIFFKATDGVYGEELWRSDGTDTGTVMAVDIRLNSKGSGPHNFSVFNNKLFFCADDSTGMEPWITDGTAQGSHLLGDLCPGYFPSFPIGFVAANNKLYFDAHPGVGGGDYSLFETDGTSIGTFLFKSHFSAAPPILYKGKYYFSASESSTGVELWSSDTSLSNIALLKDIAPGTASSNPSKFTIFKDHFYFIASDTINNNQLYVSDGTIIGTHIIKPSGAAKPGPLSYANQVQDAPALTEYHDALYFIANYDGTGQELWCIKEGPAQIIRVTNYPGFNIYPNPSDGNFTIQMPAGVNEAALTVTDVSGKLVYSTKTAADIKTTVLKLAGQPAGLYNVTIKNAGMNISKQVILHD